MTESADLEAVAQYAISSMGDTPRALRGAIKHMSSIREVGVPDQQLNWVANLLESAGPNNATQHAIGLALRTWDRIENPSWANSTQSVTRERRLRIYKLLKIPPSLADLFDRRMPAFTESEVPIVIAVDHEPWYSEARRRNRYYWDAYCRYLREKRRFSADDVSKLDEATDAVVERMADPSQFARFQSKGLVVGYVQSGKTTHFTGVLAKAADAGYRLIIVLAGTMDILRQQTQRRIDKELIGMEFVEQEYANDKDWGDFNSHGEKPSTVGHYDWQRLTNSEEDYQALKQGIAALDFKVTHRDKPFFDAINLRTSEARLIVIKKNAAVLRRLVKDLARIRSKLAHVPSLIIDDESDQASINTIDPRKIKDRTRTETNRVIVELLQVLPRAQYVGYTATPFANALINADDAEDLFPREFIVGLPRPIGYMGVSDFYDEEPVPAGFKSNQRAFVRDVKGDDKLVENLQQAIDMFVLSGAIKVFRAQHDPERFIFDHHTMLVHHSPFRKVHDEQAREVRKTFEEGGYHSGKGIERLDALFNNDVTPVSKAQERDLPFPKSFEALKPFIGECLRRINSAQTVRVVNGDNKDDTPNFEKGSVWAILVGGAKLSRGYTIEGLTVTYYRRVSTAADTLMQMGRWFGFRSGYRDLVRLFIGRSEPIGRSGKRSLDLYEAFHALCLDEDEFRQDIQKYRKDGLKPINVPPLVPSHLSALAPTARNKMYNAKIVFRNFGGTHKERTVAPTGKADARKNEALAQSLLGSSKWATESFAFSLRGEPVSIDAFCSIVEPGAVIEYLDRYVWESRGNVLADEIDYLRGARGDPAIDEWMVIAPITKGVKESWPANKNAALPSLPVRVRSRVGRRFKIFSEPQHVAVANYLSRIDRTAIKQISGSIAKWDKARTAVMLFYPVRDAHDDFVTMGFALHFPPNSLDKKLAWTVRRRGEDGEAAPIVIDKSSGTTPIGPTSSKKQKEGRALRSRSKRSG